jgi:predicted DCC family thiol-disulfide oxidoreductase YuxK
MHRNTPVMNEAVILYDRSCAFCRCSVERVLRWDRNRRLRPVALQDPEADELLEGMDLRARMASWHLVEENGTIHSAGAAFAPLLHRLPGGRPLAWLTTALPGPTERAYRYVARTRGPARE